MLAEDDLLFRHVATQVQRFLGIILSNKVKLIMDEFDDNILIEKVKRGEKEAFSGLVRRHQRKIFSLVYSMTRNISDTDDLTQEIFMMAFRSLKKFQKKSNFFTWLYRIAVNHTLNHLKKKARDNGFLELPEANKTASNAPGVGYSPEKSSLDKELQILIEKAVESLPPIYKTSFLLVAQQGLTHLEAAKALGCSESTVSWRMHVARKMLQKKLRPYVFTEEEKT